MLHFTAKQDFSRLQTEKLLHPQVIPSLEFEILNCNMMTI